MSVSDQISRANFYICVYVSQLYCFPFLKAVSTRFKFSINEGGLTLLRPMWYDEWQKINSKVEDVMPQARVWNVATKKREEVMHHLQYTWHSRHDYWLLAGIHVHGYMRWADILADPRFHLLDTGLDGLLADGNIKNGRSSIVFCVVLSLCFKCVDHRALFRLTCGGITSELWHFWLSVTSVKLYTTRR